jgi:hypothetical protein
MPRTRRPLSPSSLRDVDLTHDGDLPPRKYPAPPTGHDLMALFPPAAPETFPEMRPGPTSGYFQRQERAFFAQAGKEIVRFRVEVDVPHDLESGDGSSGKSRAVGGSGSSRTTWPVQVHAQLPPHPQYHSPAQSSASPVHFTHPNSRQPRGMPVSPVTTNSPFPMTTHPHSSPPASANLHPTNIQHPSMGVRTPPQDSPSPNAKTEPQPEEHRDDPDEAWRRPMPYAERRRAGKHTRRVIVRN